MCMWHALSKAISVISTCIHARCASLLVWPADLIVAAMSDTGVLQWALAAKASMESYLLPQ